MPNSYDYAQYSQYDQISNNCIEYLINNNEDIWKLLKYVDNKPLSHDNLTKKQKSELVYSGQPDSTEFRVFLDRGQDDAITEMQCVLKISPYSIHPVDYTNGKVSVLFEVYSGYKINHMVADDYYTTRIDCIVKNLILTLNGADITGLGRISLNKKQSYDNGTKQYGSSPWKGAWLIMSNNMA